MEIFIPYVIYSLNFTDGYHYRELVWLYFHDESLWTMCGLTLLTAFPEPFLWKKINKNGLLSGEELLFKLFSPQAYWLSDYKLFFPNVLGENTSLSGEAGKYQLKTIIIYHPLWNLYSYHETVSFCCMHLAWEVCYCRVIITLETNIT